MLNLSFYSTVTRLREQWDETSNCVMKRKSELVAMLGDSQRLLFMIFTSPTRYRDVEDKATSEID